jgi:hypothetical protein
MGGLRNALKTLVGKLVADHSGYIDIHAEIILK